MKNIALIAQIIAILFYNHIINMFYMLVKTTLLLFSIIAYRPLSNFLSELLNGAYLFRSLVQIYFSTCHACVSAGGQ